MFLPTSQTKSFYINAKPTYDSLWSFIEHGLFGSNVFVGVCWLKQNTKCEQVGKLKYLKTSVTGWMFMAWLFGSELSCFKVIDSALPTLQIHESGAKADLY